MLCGTFFLLLLIEYISQSQSCTRARLPFFSMWYNHAPINWTGLTVAKPGAVAFKFERRAAIFCEADLSEDELIAFVIEAEVDDAELEETDARPSPVIND